MIEWETKASIRQSMTVMAEWQVLRWTAGAAFFQETRRGRAASQGCQWWVSPGWNTSPAGIPVENHGAFVNSRFECRSPPPNRSGLTASLLKYHGSICRVIQQTNHPKTPRTIQQSFPGNKTRWHICLGYTTFRPRLEHWQLHHCARSVYDVAVQISDNDVEGICLADPSSNPCDLAVTRPEKHASSLEARLVHRHDLFENPVDKLSNPFVWVNVYISDTVSPTILCLYHFVSASLSNRATKNYWY